MRNLKNLKIERNRKKIMDALQKVLIVLASIGVTVMVVVGFVKLATNASDKLNDASSAVENVMDQSIGQTYLTADDLIDINVNRAITVKPKSGTAASYAKNEFKNAVGSAVAGSIKFTNASLFTYKNGIYEEK